MIRPLDADIRYNDWGALVLDSPFYGRSLRCVGSESSLINGIAYFGMWYVTSDGFNLHTRRIFQKGKNGEWVPSPDRGIIDAYKTNQWGQRIDFKV